ncbi:protein SPO16 homolog isoform X1 [Haliotis rufescens]|uniref:protein SPO16 homolog isoform X1 n=1 Tax=Haliotis rufescens TaxID=6454 RepID=UPI00201F7A72|nr:protein SPO16 homolog isoform X1 [Haliotis rufescens]
MAGPVGAWPVILHQSLEKSEISRLLRQKNFKIRNSESVTNNSIIFPMSGVAFMILHLKDVISDGCIRAEVWERLAWLSVFYLAAAAASKSTRRISIDKFIQVHRRCYILAEAPCHAEQEQCVFSAIQEKYMTSSLQMIPVHTPAESIQAMLNISKSLCKPMGEVVTRRFQGVLTHAMCGDVTGAALTQLGLTEPQIQFIQDGIGNLAQLASASREDLLNCSLDTDTADRILDIFHK